MKAKTKDNEISVDAAAAALNALNTMLTWSESYGLGHSVLNLFVMSLAATDLAKYAKELGLSVNTHARVAEPKKPARKPAKRGAK
jgi:hypothetical protein